LGKAFTFDFEVGKYKGKEVGLVARQYVHGDVELNILDGYVNPRRMWPPIIIKVTKIV